MSESFDIRTLFALSAAVHLVLALAVALAWWELRRGADLGRFALGQGLSVVGSAVLALRGVVPPAAVIPANLLLVYGIGLLAEGTRHFFGRPVRKSLTFAALALAGANILAVQLAPPGAEPRNLLANAVVAFLFGSAAWTAFRHGGGTLGSRLFGASFSASALAFVIRLAAAFGGVTWNTRPGLTPHWSTALALFISLLGAIGWTFGLLLSANRRFVERLRASERAAIRAKEAALHADNQKSLFLANMSHEIRTPLNAVIGMASLLAGTRLTAEQQEAVVTIRTSGDALLTVLADLLDLAKIEAGALNLTREPFDLADCVRQTARIFQAMAAEKGLTLTVHLDERLPARVVGDQGRLRQVLINLIGNAVKFTARGGVEVRVEPVRIAGQPWRCRFLVRDSGVGISEPQQLRLFRPFVQADSSTTRRFGGAGLGLAISKRLVERMGGTISVTSREGEGSTFTVELVYEIASQAPVRPEAASPPPAAPARALRVLLVEDNPVNQLVTLRMLERFGCASALAGNGRLALEALAEGSFDVVLMDVQMPEMDGLQAARAIRERWPERTVRIIGLTASALGSDRAAGLAAGMDDYLSKPIRFEQLAAALGER